MKYIYFKTFEKFNTDHSSSNKYFGSVVTTRFMDKNQNYQSAIRISFKPEKFVDSDSTTLYDNGFRIKSISYINKSDYNNTFSVYEYSNQTSSTSSDSQSSYDFSNIYTNVQFKQTIPYEQLMLHIQQFDNIDSSSSDSSSSVVGQPNLKFYFSTVENPTIPIFIGVKNNNIVDFNYQVNDDQKGYPVFASITMNDSFVSLDQLPHKQMNDNGIVIGKKLQLVFEFNNQWQQISREQGGIYNQRVAVDTNKWDQEGYFIPQKVQFNQVAQALRIINGEQQYSYIFIPKTQSDAMYVRFQIGDVDTTLVNQNYYYPYVFTQQKSETNIQDTVSQKDIFTNKKTNVMFKFNGVENTGNTITSLPRYHNSDTVYCGEISQSSLEQAQNDNVKIYRYSYKINEGDFTQFTQWMLLKDIDLTTFENYDNDYLGYIDQHGELEGLNAIFGYGYDESSSSTTSSSVSRVPASGDIVTLKIQVADNQFNCSPQCIGSFMVYQTLPTINVFQIIGTNNNRYYTGVNKENDVFEIDSKIKVNFLASTNVQPLYYRLRSTNNDFYDEYITKNSSGTLTVNKYSEWTEFERSSQAIVTKILRLRPYSDSNGYADIMDQDETVKIVIDFKDGAGNIATQQQTIRFNTRIFKTANDNLKETNNSYQPAIWTIAPDSQQQLLSKQTQIQYNQQDPSSVSNMILWQPISFPENNFMQTGNPKTVVQQYPALLSSQLTVDESGQYVDLKYWIIDNTQSGQYITLQFVSFGLDDTPFGPPYNSFLGKGRPDTLRIYDASDSQCIRQFIDQSGKKVYKLVEKDGENDGEKLDLKLIDQFTGYGKNVKSLINGLVNSNDYGGFTKAFQTNRICIMLLTDCNNSSKDISKKYGFYIKGKHINQEVWDNYSIDNKNGLLWVHNYKKNTDSNINKVEGISTDKLKMAYIYLKGNIDIDYENGYITIDKQYDDIYANYQYYTYDQNQRPDTFDYLLPNDDLVEYQNISIYNVFQGTNVTSVKNKIVYYEEDEEKGIINIYNKNDNGTKEYDYSGKLSKYFYLDKDRGIVTFRNGQAFGDKYSLVPYGRMYADYQYHTFMRLGNDGYSDFEFKDSTLVADVTNKYNDYSYGDVKITNQGDVELINGSLKFMPRGVVQDGGDIVTQVLDFNRPWDYQLGTAQETYDNTRWKMSTNYNWDSYTCSREDVNAIFSASDGSGSGASTINLQPKQHCYGRIVIRLGDEQATKFPATTSGKKKYSCEVSGKYYQQQEM